MRAVIIRHKKNSEKVDRLVQHCLDLDGTQLEVHDQTKKFIGLPYPEVTYAGWRDVMTTQQEPYFFLEDDAVPLVAGWLGVLEAEYERLGRRVMVSTDLQTPFDLYSGIGVYDPAILQEIPEGLCDIGWDEWIATYRPAWLCRTHLIQHSYGCYNKDGIAAGWEFPRDRWIIRDTTLIFHKDGQQGLLG